MTDADAIDNINSEPAVTLDNIYTGPCFKHQSRLHCYQKQPTSQQGYYQVQVSMVFMFIHYTMAGLSPTEGVIMPLPLIAEGAGTCEKRSL